jgi:hypothetical protein
MMKQQERRRHARFPFGRFLEVRAPAPVGKMLVRARDVSERGFSFATEVDLQVGDRIQLGLRHDEDVLVEATVRNVRQEGGFFIVGAERTDAPEPTVPFGPSHQSATLAAARRRGTPGCA